MYKQWQNESEQNNVDMIGKRSYKLKVNRRKKTYTIRTYDENGKLIAKYRSYPQGNTFSEDWAEGDIYHFLRTDEYYLVKAYI